MLTWISVEFGDNSNIAGFGSKFYIPKKIVHVNAREDVMREFMANKKALYSFYIKFVQFMIQLSLTQVTVLQNWYFSEKSLKRKITGKILFCKIES